MLFHEGVFMQVLEGPAAGVTRLMEKTDGTGGMQILSCWSPARWRREAFIAARNLSAGEKQAFSELRQKVAARPGAFPAGLGLSDFLAAFAAEPA
jgi:hypothetical protein